MTDRDSAYLQGCLERLQQGDEAARKELLNGACERLRQLTHAMLGDYQRLRRWEQTDDVVQGAMMRLYRALEQVTPPSLRHFYRLATLQVRRELIDLARHHYGPEGPGRRHESVAEPPAEASFSLEPGRLAMWSEFHQRVEATLVTAYLLIGSHFVQTRWWIATPMTSAERQLWSIRLGQMKGLLMIVVAVRWLSAPDLMVYPLWAILAGSGMFSLGGAFWGRLYLIGLGFFATAVLMLCWLELGPLLLGAALSLMIGSLGIHLRRLAREEGA